MTKKSKASVKSEEKAPFEFPSLHPTQGGLYKWKRSKIYISLNNSMFLILIIANHHLCALRGTQVMSLFFSLK